MNANLTALDTTCCSQASRRIGRPLGTIAPHPKRVPAPTLYRLGLDRDGGHPFYRRRRSPFARTDSVHLIHSPC